MEHVLVNEVENRKLWCNLPNAGGVRAADVLATANHQTKLLCVVCPSIPLAFQNIVLKTYVHTLPISQAIYTILKY